MTMIASLIFRHYIEGCEDMANKRSTFLHENLKMD
jgi:hypothetical protein